MLFLLTNRFFVLLLRQNVSLFYGGLTHITGKDMEQRVANRKYAIFKGRYTYLSYLKPKKTVVICIRFCSQGNPLLVVELNPVTLMDKT